MRGATWEGRLTVASSPLCKYREHRLWFRVVSPELLRAGGPAPLVVLHGGPQVPSDYLFDLERLGSDRSVIFYDQLGCGRSDAPSPDMRRVYSVASSVRDVHAVLRGLRVPRYHLYGQSWGGLLAAHVASSKDTTSLRLPPPLSLTLSNTPSSVTRRDRR
jgi:proline iminopeptidase